MNHVAVFAFLWDPIPRAVTEPARPLTAPRAMAPWGPVSVCVFVCLARCCCFFVFCFIGNDRLPPPLVPTTTLHPGTPRFHRNPNSSVTSFWQKCPSGLGASSPHPRGQIDGLESLSVTSAAIFQRRVEKKHISHLKEAIWDLFLVL